jgi:hypothetical protein
VSRRWLVVAGCVALLLVGAAWLRHLAQTPRGTPTRLILAQIQRARAAAEERNVGALMRVVSSDFKDENGITRPALAYQIRDQLRDAQSVEVEIPPNELQIQVAPGGREATTTGRIRVRITERQGGTRAMDFRPTVQWRKEHVRHYLLFPAEEWHVARTRGIGAGEGE